MLVPNLKAVRSRAYLTQKELAAKSGIALATIKAIEGGKGARFSTIKTLAATLGVEPDALTMQTEQTRMPLRQPRKEAS